uniref:Putative mRNA interferase YoeB n=1 Tax=Candidatus Kentrum sp. DK TaxID=2126562 RepID=A0A450S851_9GAMM|nr:MAG: toxin-antitoxin system, toxin component, Txe/YoeB family [Candidatus Kentron sp. DK]
MNWRVVLSKTAAKDAVKLQNAGLTAQAKRLLAILAEDPFERYPRYEKLVGNLSGYYSRRITIRHRLVYSVDEEERVVHVLRMWSHYE